MPRLYHVQLTQAQAVSAALELAGPGARVLRLWREGEW